MSHKGSDERASQIHHQCRFLGFQPGRPRCRQCRRERQTSHAREKRGAETTALSACCHQQRRSPDMLQDPSTEPASMCWRTKAARCRASVHTRRSRHSHDQHVIQHQRVRWGSWEPHLLGTAAAPGNLSGQLCTQPSSLLLTTAVATEESTAIPPNHPAHVK